MNAKEAYVLSRKYTKETAQQFGALKGAPCQIESIVDNFNKSHTMNFLWENNEGAQQRGQLTVEDGEDGTYIVNAYISQEGSAKGHLIIKLNDGSLIDAGDVNATIPIGSKDKVGGYKVGKGLSVDSDGTLNATGIEAQIDNELSTTSTNPVQNKVITAEIEKKMSAEVIGNTLTFK